MESFFYFNRFLSMQFKSKYEETTITGKQEPDKPVQVAVTIDNNVNYIDMDDYLLGSLLERCQLNLKLSFKSPGRCKSDFCL
ncbi:hypothetical protein SD457_18125 [Coprobacillaceae bacterium CR2/5/TPMF4]|nr:hypothetical protein SD457_18125 [Coprobacillaceae bacterium CR2/5/TPMF4]